MNLKIIKPDEFNREGIDVWRFSMDKKASIHHLVISVSVSKR